MDSDTGEVTADPLGAVVVGVDGRDGGRDALAFAIALGGRHLTLLSAGAPDERETAAVRAYGELLHEDMTRTMQAARVEPGVVSDTVWIDDAFAARALHRTAEERAAGLIVVGSAHHGSVGRLVLGDVTRGVLHVSPCPVAIAPRGYHEHPGRVGRIAVGYDGSPEAREALALAGELALIHEAEIQVHVVWDGPTLYVDVMGNPDEIAQLDAEHRERAERRLAEALDTLGPSASGAVHHGSPAVELARVSAEADVLVLGSRGLGPAHRVALGGTADRLIHESACAVIVVPRGARLRP